MFTFKCEILELNINSFSFYKTPNKKVGSCDLTIAKKNKRKLNQQKTIFFNLYNDKS